MSAIFKRRSPATIAAASADAAYAAATAAAADVAAATATFTAAAAAVTAAAAAGRGDPITSAPAGKAPAWSDTDLSGGGLHSSTSQLNLSRFGR